jgi:hypothetical protein
MSISNGNSQTDRLIADLSSLWQDKQDQELITKAIHALEPRYGLVRKLANEPGVEDILKQMTHRLARAYPRLADVQNKKILDIACGSNTSKLPASGFIHTLLRDVKFDPNRGYTALFEPWFCRILFELQAIPVGVDFGDLESEVFIHHRVDLGKPGALDFLPEHSFDGIQDSRLFGSPEFTAQFPNPADRQKVAREITRQESRLLKSDGIIIHSDAAAMMK